MRKRTSEQSELRAIWRKSGLTQEQFAARYIGNNPRTHKPYNARTLRKWMSGEIKRTTTPIAQIHRGGGYFQQHFTDKEGNDYSVILANTYDSPRNSLFSPE